MKKFIGLSIGILIGILFGALLNSLLASHIVQFTIQTPDTQSSYYLGSYLGEITPLLEEKMDSKHTVFGQLKAPNLNTRVVSSDSFEVTVRDQKNLTAEALLEAIKSSNSNILSLLLIDKEIYDDFSKKQIEFRQAADILFGYFNIDPNNIVDIEKFDSYLNMDPSILSLYVKKRNVEVGLDLLKATQTFKDKKAAFEQSSRNYLQIVEKKRFVEAFDNYLNSKKQDVVTIASPFYEPFRAKHIVVFISVIGWTLISYFFTVQFFGKTK